MKLITRGRFALGATLVVAAVAAVIWWQTPTQEQKRRAYEQMLAEHPLNNLDSYMAAHPTAVPPDKANAQYWLETMDPALGYAPVEKTWELYEQRKAAQKSPDARSKRAGLRSGTALSWTERGPTNIGGRCRALAWDPNDAMGRKVWAGGVTGGLWYNLNITDANSRWVKVDDFWDNLAVSAIAFDPVNPQIIYVGTGEGYFTGASRGAGIWKSTNGGTTWARLTSTTDMFYVQDLAVRNESGTGVLYVGVNNYSYQGLLGATFRPAGLWRSSNGGTSFSQVLPNVTGFSITYGVADIEISASGRIFVGTNSNVGGSGGGHILYSDAGTAGTWTVNTQYTGILGVGRVELACAPSNSNVVYSLVEANSAAAAMGRSTDGGATFTAITEPIDIDTGIPDDDFTRGQAWYDLIMDVDPNDPNHVIAGGIDLFDTYDGGANWSHVSRWLRTGGLQSLTCSDVHADQHAIAFKPGSSSEVIFGTDGGVYWTNQFSLARTNIVIGARNFGFNVTQFYAGDASAAGPGNFTIGGTQDNGTQGLSLNQAGPSFTMRGGDGMFCFVDPTSDRQIASNFTNIFGLYQRRGTQFVASLVSSQTGSFVNPAAPDWLNNRLYSANGTSDIRSTTIQTSANTTASVPITGIGARASAFAISPSTTLGTSVVWVGTQAGRLFRVTIVPGSSATPTSVTPVEFTGASFPTSNLRSISFGSSANQILVTFSNYGVSSVFESRDGGSTWQDKEGNLPDLPVRWAVYNPNNTNQVYLATELGTYATNDVSVASPTWVESDGGLANVRVDMLRTDPSGKMLYAFTHGRGMFAAPLPGSTAIPAIESGLLADNYSFTPTNGTYTPITGTLVASGGSTLDDDIFHSGGRFARAYTSFPEIASGIAGFPIGFTFRMDGVDYTHFAPGTNGHLKLMPSSAGAQASVHYEYAYEGGLTTTTNFIGNIAETMLASSDAVLSPLMLDIIENPGSSLRYELQGTAPNRVLVVQWGDFDAYGDGSEQGLSFNFQVRLHETTNRVQYVYGNVTGSAASRRLLVGLRSTGVSNHVFVGGTFGAPSYNQSPFAPQGYIGLSSATQPVSGRTFTFDPITTNVETASSVISELEVFPNPASTEVWVRARVTNPKRVTVRIHALNGQVVHTEDFAAVSEINERVLLQNLSRGTYVLAVDVGGNVRTQKLVVQ